MDHQCTRLKKREQGRSSRFNPSFRLAWNNGFKNAQLRRTLTILESQQYAIREAWKNHFQG
jgi:hypothetical protein